MFAAKQETGAGLGRGCGKYSASGGLTGGSRGSRSSSSSSSSVLLSSPHKEVRMGGAALKTCCLYLCLIFLSGVILLTSFTIQWILYSIQFSLEGVGVVSLVEGGLKISGQTHLLNSLYANRISSVAGSPLRIFSDGNFSDFSLDNSGLKVRGGLFELRDETDRVLFSLSPGQTVIGSDKCDCLSRDSLATKAVRSPAGHSLRLESSTASLALLAPAGVDISSISGHVHVQAFRDVVFRARGHNSQLKIDAGTVLLPGLPTLQASRQARRSTNQTQTVYQLCICRTGRLFLAPSNSQCVADSHVCRDS